MIVDACGVLLDDVLWPAYLGAFADSAPEYLRVFERRLAAYRPATFDDDWADGLRASGIRHVVAHGVSRPLPDGSSSNARLAGLCAAHPDLVQAWAGLDLRDPDAAAVEARRALGDLGMRGLSIIPFLDGVAPEVEAVAPVFDVAAEFAVPVWVHVGHHFSRRAPLEISSWHHVDGLARAWPEVPLVVGHGGWPWIRELVAVCQRHPNVHLEISSHRPAYMAKPGSGWEPLLLHGATTIRRQVLFGTATWVQPRSATELAAEVAGLGLGAAVTRAWLHDNAAALLGLDVLAEVG